MNKGAKLASPGPVPNPYPTRRGAKAACSRPSDRATSSISLYGPGEGEGDDEAAGDAVGAGDGEEVGDAVGVLVVAGRVEGAGVVVGAVVGTGVIVVGAVRSGRAGGSYGPLSATANAVPTTTVTSRHAGVSTTTSSTRTNGRTHPSKTYHHNNAAITIISATDSHHG